MSEPLNKPLSSATEETQLALLEKNVSSTEQNAVRAKMQRNRMRSFLPLVLVVLVLFSGLFRRHLFFLLFLFLCGYVVMQYRSKNRNDFDNDFLYGEHFFLPVLRVLYPKADFTYKGGIDQDILKYILPQTDRYETSSYVRFHGHNDMELCNVYAHHTESETGNNNDTKYHEVTDFKGQVYVVDYPSNVNGYIRIVPDKKMQISDTRIQPHYFRFNDGGMKIETEDIENNERYAVTCTDELAARKFLNPSVLKWLDEQIEVPVSIYITQNHLYFALYTDKKIFCAPITKKSIDKLSLTSVYKDLQQEMTKTDELIHILLRNA